MPDTYVPGVIDVAGCMLGTVATGVLLDGSRVRPGDVVLGLAGSGLHTNGYSLARRVLASSKHSLADALPGGTGERLGDALLAPHRWYGPSVLPLAQAGRIRAMAHVTGGGIAGNLVRVLPEGCRAHLSAAAWPRPALFRWLIAEGAVPEDDARSAMNLGVGLVLVASAEAATGIAADLAAAGETVWRLGEIVPGSRTVEWNGP